MLFCGFKGTHMFLKVSNTKYYFYGHIIIWPQTSTDMSCLCLIKVPGHGLYFPWQVILVAIGRSRQGTWVYYSILRLFSWVIVKLCLSKESEEMLIKKIPTHNFLWCWGSGKSSTADVSVLLLSSKDLQTVQKIRVQPRLQNTQRVGAEHEFLTRLFSFSFHILVKKKVLLILVPQASAGMGAHVLCCLLYWMACLWFGFGLQWCKTSWLEVGSLGAWLHNPKQTGSEMQNPLVVYSSICLARESQLQAWGQLLLQDLVLQSWGTFAIWLRVVNAAVNAHKLWVPSAKCAVPWTSETVTGKMS